MKKLKIATVFSGIGAPETALKKLGVEYEIAFACDNGERELNVSQQEIEILYLHATTERLSLTMTLMLKEKKFVP